MKEDESIILFDGVCNLCNGFVQFVIERDAANRFKFASLQSDVAQSYLMQLPPAVRSIESIVLIQNGRYYQQSAAALRILRGLTGGWPLLYAFMILPAFLRDGVYRLVAKNRYRWFGQQASCMLPTPELKARFL
ncbi:thiol-disulfide oxidoreductase DCC family protein [Adhaeribacter aquaticus]|uniref:thiol-disulfide oxidoreductase DCC family protein n=1 Tax=Adhaeribacter aquaticus TaxID=299567 RepID=UPI00047C6385|nr:thiol-disulfide oxidoreductase DCC family protein [Adhaeribacter aquaticus]